jgi:hypothetical protein
MGFLKNLFGKKQKPVFDIEKAVSEYLLRMPQCNEDVVIVSPKYGEKHFTCEIVVAANDLLPWADHHADAVWSSNKEEQAARQALPLWLRCADSSNKCASYVPHFMFKVLRLYVHNFINEGIARVFCFECQSFVSDLNRKKINEKQSGDWSWWTDVWTCPQGHQLYYEEHKLHIYRLR